MSVFVPSFGINDMHVQTIFIEDLEKPLVPVNCYFGLYIKTEVFIPSLLARPETDTSRIIKRELCLKPVSYPTLLMLLREQRCIFGRHKIGTFCTRFYTQTNEYACV